MRSGLIICFFFIGSLVKAQSAKDYAVQLQATVTESPASITLTWPLFSDQQFINYEIFKKPKSNISWGEPIAALSPNTTQFIDVNVSVDSNYEYYVRRNFTDSGRVAHGYIFVGIKSREVSYKGKMLLLVDHNYVLPLQNEIQQLNLDLVADGWQVKRFVIERTLTVDSVKKIILKEYHMDSNTKAVYLLGHIPVPYSGGFKIAPGQDYPPDGHSDHEGAWPADMYYASMDEEIWTDTSVNMTSMSRPQANNIPGDGKFDLNYVYPSTPLLQVGRVDLSNMPAFGSNDTLRTKRYLDRVHIYKYGGLNVNRRALIDDNFGAFGGEAFASSGWRNSSTMFGDSVFERDYFTSTKQGSYQVAFGCGGGSYTSCDGIGNTSRFVTDSTDIIFSMLFGSYFGDWNTPDNLLRAPLCSKQPALASMWNGRPHWYLHHMSLGENIGYSTLLTQANFYYFKGPDHLGYFPGYSQRRIHIALMGDPSLRLHPIKPSASLSAFETAEFTKIRLSWSPSPDAQGYLILRSSSEDGKFVPIGRLTKADTSFADKRPEIGRNYYMVRAMRLENTPSGTYYNLSLGVVNSIIFRKKPTPPEGGPIADPGLIPFTVKLFPNPSRGRFNLRMETNNNNYSEVTLLDVTGHVLQRKIISRYDIDTEIIPVTPLNGLYFVKITQGKETVIKKIYLTK